MVQHQLVHKNWSLVDGYYQILQLPGGGLLKYFLRCTEYIALSSTECERTIHRWVVKCCDYPYRNMHSFYFARYLPHRFSVTTEFQNNYVQNCNKKQKNHFWQGRYSEKYCQGESPHYTGKESIVGCVTWKFIHCFICSTRRNDNYWTAGIGIPNPRHTANLEKRGEVRRGES